MAEAYASAARFDFAPLGFDAELVMVSIENGARRPLARDRRALSSPRWSRSGDRLAFLTQGASAKPQVVVMQMAGGAYPGDVRHQRRPGHDHAVRLRDIDRRWVAWLKQYLEGRAPAQAE